MWMTHPDLPGEPVVETNQDAFDLAYRLRGWVECDPPPEPDFEEPEAADLADIPIEEPELDELDNPEQHPTDPAASGDTEE